MIGKGVTALTIQSFAICIQRSTAVKTQSKMANELEQGTKLKMKCDGEWVEGGRWLRESAENIYQDETTQNVLKLRSSCHRGKAFSSF